MLEMVEDMTLPNRRRATVARRNDRFFVVVGPRANAEVLGPYETHLDALRRVCTLLNAGSLS